MGNEESCDVAIEQKGNSDLDIHEYAFGIAYLQVGKVSVELTPKEYEGPTLCIRPLNISSGKATPSYGCGWMDECGLCFAHNSVKAFSAPCS
jgi:hypothetical protein